MRDKEGEARVAAHRHNLASLMLADQHPQARPAQVPVAVPAAVQSEPAWPGPDADPAADDDAD